MPTLESIKTAANEAAMSVNALKQLYINRPNAWNEQHQQALGDIVARLEALITYYGRESGEISALIAGIAAAAAAEGEEAAVRGAPPDFSGVIDRIGTLEDDIGVPPPPLPAPPGAQGPPAVRPEAVAPAPAQHGGPSAASAAAAIPPKNAAELQHKNFRPKKRKQEKFLIKENPHHCEVDVKEHLAKNHIKNHAEHHADQRAADHHIEDANIKEYLA